MCHTQEAPWSLSPSSWDGYPGLQQLLLLPSTWSAGRKPMLDISQLAKSRIGTTYSTNNAQD